MVAILKSKTLQCQPVYYYYYYCYVPQSMIKIISWNRFHGKTCRGKNFYPPTHTLIMPPIVYCRPLPPYCCYVRSSYICIRKKLPFPLQKYTEIFSSPEFSRRTYMPCRWTPIRRNYVKLHLEKKSSKKKSAWWKRTLLSADVWKKKKVLNVKFFLTCSRATSSEEQICLKTKILIEVYGKKKKTTMKETKQTTFICYYCWLTLTKSIFSWNQFFTKISILYLERNREQQTNTNIHEVTSWRLVWTKNDDDFEDLIDVKDHAKKEDKCSKLAVYDSIWKFIQKKPNFSHYSTRISGIILNFLNSTAIATLLLLLLQLT